MVERSGANQCTNGESSMNGATKATHEEICDAAMGHYEEISSKASDWMNTVPIAIKFYRKYAGVLDIKNLRPKDDIVIAKPIQFERVSAGGIVIPETADQPITGIVIAVGPGKVLKNGNRKPMDVSVGDKILFSKWANLDMTIDGTDLKIVREDSIVGVIEE